MLLPVLWRALHQISSNCSFVAWQFHYSSQQVYWICHTCKLIWHATVATHVMIMLQMHPHRAAPGAEQNHGWVVTERLPLPHDLDVEE